MSPRPPSDLTAISDLVPSMLRELGMVEAELAVRIGERWSEYVGEELAAHSRPVVLRHGVLEVSTDSASWSQQLQLHSSDVLAALARALGPTAPKTLRLVTR